MTPEFIATAHWNDLAVLVVSLWFLVLFTVAFALSILLGHAIIPSLIFTGHLPAATQWLRPLFYLTAMAALAVDIAIISRIGGQASILQTIYPRFYQ